MKKGRGSKPGNVMHGSGGSLRVRVSHSDGLMKVKKTSAAPGGLKKVLGLLRNGGCKSCRIGSLLRGPSVKRGVSYDWASGGVVGGWGMRKVESSFGSRGGRVRIKRGPQNYSV